MRLPNDWRSLLRLRVRSKSVISTACEWCMIIPCMKLMSGAEGGRKGAAAVAVEESYCSARARPVARWERYPR